MNCKIKNRLTRYTKIVTFLLFISFTLNFAQNSIYINNISNNTATVELHNSDMIAALQFTIHSTNGILLKDIEKESRFSDAAWFVATNVKNESTLTVVVINSHLEELTPGKGSIIKIHFEKNIQTTTMGANFRLSEIIFSDKNGKSVPVDTTNEFEIAGMQELDDVNLLQNFPNPFNPFTTISYKIESHSMVELTIYDMAGRVIKKLVDNFQSEGSYSVVWNSTNSSNQEVASGTYFYQLLVNGKSTVKKLLLQK